VKTRAGENVQRIVGKHYIRTPSRIKLFIAMYSLANLERIGFIRKKQGISTQTCQFEIVVNRLKH